MVLAAARDCFENRKSGDWLPGEQADGTAKQPIERRCHVQARRWGGMEEVWRRRGDSNPRYSFTTVQRFSKPPP